jgi:hypothetical protein
MPDLRRTLALLLALLPAAAPAATSPTAHLPPPLELSVPGAREPTWRLWVGLAEGAWTEAKLDDTRPSFGGTLGLEWRPQAYQTVRLDLGGESYRRTYAFSAVPAGGVPVRSTTGEVRWAAQASYAHEVLHYWGGGKTALELQAQLGQLVFDQPVVGTSALPLGLGLRLTRALSDALDLRLDAGWAYAAGATDPRSASVFGKLTAATGYGLVASWRTAAGHRVEVGYRGEALTYQHDYRFLHSLTLQVGLGL